MFAGLAITVSTRLGAKPLKNKHARQLIAHIFLHLKPGPSGVIPAIACQVRGKVNESVSNLDKWFVVFFVVSQSTMRLMAGFAVIPED